MSSPPPGLRPPTPPHDLSRSLRHRAEWSPDRVALHFAGADLTYAALDRRVRALAGGLAHGAGVGAGDRVAYLGYNAPAMLELLFACARLGAMLVPLNWRLTAAEHRALLDDAEPRALVAEPEFRAHAESLGRPVGRLVACDPLAAATAPPAGSGRPAERRHPGRAAPAPPPHAAAPEARVAMPSAGATGTEWIAYESLVAGGAEAPAAGTLDAPLLLVYTSGTTGRPKGAVLTQGAIFWTALNSIAAHDLTSADHVLTVLPMFHVGGLNIQTTPALLAGATVTVARRFEPDETLTLIERRRPTLLLAVPAVARALSDHPRFPTADLSSLRCLATGSSTVPEAVMRPWMARGVPVTQVYGMTESGPTAIALSIADAARKLGSCGLPCAHTEARVVDAGGRDVPPGERGEIWLRGPHVMSGYWRNPDATAEALAGGWLHTGDVGHVDADGFFHVDDRKKDVVISGGENVYPAELESILADCPQIAEAAVIGRPDARWGEIPIACVVRTPDASLTRADVLALFHDRIARYKHPREVIFLDALPRTAMGKVEKFTLRAQLNR